MARLNTLISVVCISRKYLAIATILVIASCGGGSPKMVEEGDGVETSGNQDTGGQGVDSGVSFAAPHYGYDGIPEVIEGYDVITTDSETVIEGDVIFPITVPSTFCISDQELDGLSQSCRGLTFNRARYVGRLWPAGIVPYKFSNNLPSTPRRAFIDAAELISSISNITFVEVLNEEEYPDHIEVRKHENSNEGRSAIGKQGGKQFLLLGDSAGYGLAAHEIFHALGVLHEQSRPDRDRFVRILGENIRSDREGNYRQRSEIEAGVLGPYDYLSIMHYWNGAFSSCADGSLPRKEEGLSVCPAPQPIVCPDGVSTPGRNGFCPTMEALESIPGANVTCGANCIGGSQFIRGGRMGQMTGLTSSDVDGINQLYPAASSSKILAAWQDDSDGNGLHQLYATGFSELGHKTFPDVKVNDVDSGEQRYLDIATNTSGQTVAVWEDDLNGNGIYEILATGIERDGTIAFANLQVNSVSSGNQAKPAVGINGRGNFVVVWEDDRDGNGSYQILGRGFTFDGAQSIEEFTVNSEGAGQQLDPDIAMNSSGEFVVVWEDDSNRNDKYEILARGFTSFGSESFSDTLVNTTGAGQQLNPAVSIDSGGNTVVVWQDDSNNNGFYEILSTGFNRNGTRNFRNIIVNQISSGEQRNPDVTFLNSTGDYVVTWEDDANRNGKYEIEMVAFSSSNMIWVQQTVNKDSSGQQLSPSIASSGSGKFVVVWQDDRDGNGKYEIVLRGFNSRGEEEFDEIVVNDVSAGNQIRPVVAYIQ